MRNIGPGLGLGLRKRVLDSQCWPGTRPRVAKPGAELATLTLKTLQGPANIAGSDQKLRLDE